MQKVALRARPFMQISQRNAKLTSRRRDGLSAVAASGAERKIGVEGKIRAAKVRGKMREGSNGWFLETYIESMYPIDLFRSGNLNSSFVAPPRTLSNADSFPFFPSIRFVAQDTRIDVISPGNFESRVLAASKQGKHAENIPRKRVNTKDIKLRLLSAAILASVRRRGKKIETEGFRNIFMGRDE